MASLDTAVQFPRRVGRRAKALLFFAFAFAVMADPVSSVAYAIEAALRALHGHLELLLPTMGIVIGIIALVTVNYWQLVRAFPEGGGSPEAAGRAFGEEWSFLPIGALVVDFALTISISIAAAGSAIIAYVPALAPARIPIAPGLTALAVHLHVGIPRSDSTQIADLAHTAAGGGGLYAVFQLSSSVLLLAAASSSFQAGPGLLKALARTGPGGEHGLLPPRFARTN